MYVLLADKVSCPMTQHYDSGDSQISNPSIPIFTLYELGAPFFSLEETQERNIGHCDSARQMLGCAFALF